MSEASTLEIFSTMANLQGTVVSRSVEIADVPVEGVGGCVSFAGSLSGIVYVLMPETLAARVTCAMLGCDKAEASEIKDVVGELTNMVAGGLKNQLAKEGFESCLTIPTFISGTGSKINVRNLTLAATNMIRFPGGEELVDVRIFARKMSPASSSSSHFDLRGS